MNIGHVIKDFRKQKGIKQGEFAELCKVSQTYLSLIESNQKDPNLSLFKTIAEQLEIPLPILFFLSLDENDVPEQKRNIFKILEPSLKDLIAQIYIDDSKS
jgi:transcriptional regulator with XRE-family HTH domain